MVSVLDLYSKDPSLNPAEDDNFPIKLIKRKRGRGCPGIPTAGTKIVLQHLSPDGGTFGTVIKN